jgi:iron-sulfur cluster assembly accessory protein
MEIKSKKAAISMVSQHQGLGEIDAQSDNQTPAALDRLRALVASPTEPKLLRIGVKTRGCAGMAYHLDYVPPPGGRFDEVVEQDGVRVLIDSKALFSIIGSTMDWRDNRLSAGFVFDKWVLLHL